MFQANEDSIVESLETIAKCQLRQTEIAEQSFKEAQELRDITMKMMKKDQEEEKEYKKAIDERIERVYRPVKLKADKKELQEPDSDTPKI